MSDQAKLKLIRLIALLVMSSVTMLVLWHFNRTRLVSVSQEQRDLEEWVGAIRSPHKAAIIGDMQDLDQTSIELWLNHGKDSEHITLSAVEPKRSLSEWQVLRLLELAQESKALNISKTDQKDLRTNYLKIRITSSGKDYESTVPFSFIKNNLPLQQMIVLARNYSKQKKKGETAHEDQG